MITINELKKACDKVGIEYTNDEGLLELIIQYPQEFINLQTALKEYEDTIKNNCSTITDETPEDIMQAGFCLGYIVGKLQ